MATDEARILPRFLRLAALNVLASVVTPLAGLADIAMLGHLDDVRYIAGVALAAVIFNYVYWSFYFLRMATTGETAQAVGRNDASEAYHALYRSLALAALVATILLLFQGPIRDFGFGLLSGAAEVETAGRQYFDARIWSAPATLMSYAFIGWFMGREEARTILAATMTANFSNIALNYVFIVQLGWAAQGSGLSTAISEYLMLGVCVVAFFRKTGRIAPTLVRLLDAERVRRLFALNRDLLLRTFVLLVVFSTFTNLNSKIGVVQLAAASIIMRFYELGAYLVDGAAFASESLAGVFRGERRLDRLQYLIRISFVVGVSAAFAFAIVAVGFPKHVFGLMTSQPAVLALCIEYSIWLAPLLLFGAVAFVYDGLMIGLTEGTALRNAMIVSGLLFIPPTFYAATTHSSFWLWVGISTFIAARGLTLFVSMQILMRVYKREWGVAENFADPSTKL
jgi:multidrug resistance protein, MATE family